MKPVMVTVVIDRSADDVFAFLDEVENNPSWLAGMQSCRWTSDPPVAVGSTYEQTARFLGKEIITSFRVVERQPGRLVKISSTAGSSFPIDVTRKVDPLDGDRCRVTEIVESDPAGFNKVASPLLPMMVRRRIQRDYLGLKAMLEAQSS